MYVAREKNNIFCNYPKYGGSDMVLVTEALHHYFGQPCFRINFSSGFLGLADTD